MDGYWGANTTRAVQQYINARRERGENDTCAFPTAAHMSGIHSREMQSCVLFLDAKDPTCALMETSGQKQYVVFVFASRLFASMLFLQHTHPAAMSGRV
eukprot:2735325-Rhodomonas_salina.2